MPDQATEPRVVLLGPPGSGKGTQGVRLAEALGVDHVSSGDLLRASVADGDPHGVAAIMAAGALVPDETLHAILLDHLPEGFVLDGYPRSATQARALDEALAPAGPGRVIEIVVPEEVLIPRLLSRAVRHRRTDDTPETIAARFEVYRNEIEGLRNAYGSRLVRVDGVGTQDEVFDRLLAAATD
jgi:adenylate kinase